MFKPELEHGLLLFNGDDGEGGDFISVYLLDGYVEFAMNLGGGVKTARYVIKIYYNFDFTV